MDITKEKIAQYLSSHPYLRLATVTENCTPQVHTVGYISEESTVYFVTDKKSRKAENIFRNPAVAFTVDENYEDVMVIQGIQMEGAAAVITKETEAIRLLELMTKKFPGIESMPPNPDLVLFKIAPSKGYFLDNTVAFGHRDMVEYQTMPAIESYNFGHMTIDSKKYTKDVIIYPDGSILYPWWRRQGHVLEVEDIEDLIGAEPEIIICGTGAMGVMQPAAGLKEHLAARNIEFIALKSSKAVETYNKVSGNRRVGGCFHLTC